MFESLEAMTRLARWLGPWADEEHAPSVLRATTVLAPTSPEEAPLRVRVYRPIDRAPRGAYLMSSGLHFNGPDDARMDRFCRILAYAGFLVHAPYIPDYQALLIKPRTWRDLGRAFDGMLESPHMPAGVRPAIFSISFGSLLAIRLAADPDLGPRLGALVLFGGYGIWEETARFCVNGSIEGRETGAHDPLNMPVVFIQAVHGIPDAPADPSPIIAAWITYMRVVWSSEEMKRSDERFEIARRVSLSLPETHRELFLQGCGARPGGQAIIAEALANLDLRHLDPSDSFPHVRCPVHIVHGADDDVIPCYHLQALDEQLSPYTTTRTYLTGLYSHTGQELPALRDVISEVSTMVGILRALAHAGATPA